MPLATQLQETFFKAATLPPLNRGIAAPETEMTETIAAELTEQELRAHAVRIAEWLALPTNPDENWPVGKYLPPRFDPTDDAAVEDLAEGIDCYFEDDFQMLDEEEFDRFVSETGWTGDVSEIPSAYVAESLFETCDFSVYEIDAEAA